MKPLDFVVGTRFHGAMAALSAAVPAFVLCHDTRTEDMCEFLNVPHANICDVGRVDIRELYEKTDLKAFSRRRSALIPAYRAFLTANGLRYRFA